MARRSTYAFLKAAAVPAFIFFCPAILSAQAVEPRYVAGLSLFIGLFNNLALLIVFASAYGFLYSRLERLAAPARQALLGIAFGVFVLGCMQVRIPVAPGVIVDQRNAVVIMAGAFGGPLCAAIAGAIAAGYRAYLGGIGIWGGMLGVCLSAIAGIAINRLRRKGDSALLLAASALVSALFIMPGFLPIGSLANGWSILKRMFAPYGSAITVGIFAGSLLLANEERRWKAKRELAESEKRYRELFESTIDTVHRSDARGIMRIVSPSCEALLGYKPEELVGKPANFFFKDPEATRKRLLEAMAPTGSVENFEAEVLRKDGSVAISSSNLRAIKDDSGAFAGIEGVSRDVTRLKAAEEEARRLEETLQQSRKMESVGNLAGGIAHDFNNILAAILGFSEILKAKLPADDPVQAEVEGILAAGMRAKDLVSQILLFSRKSAGKKVPLRIRLALRDSYSLLRASIPSTIEIKQDYGTVEGTILADSTAFHQVVMNLCTNAAQAMEETGGVLTIGLERTAFGEADLADKPGLVPGPYFAVSVGDTGPGIAPEELHRIFDPYYTTKAPGKGTGLGLSVTDGIVKSHGGFIAVRSQPGQGATFTVYLPEIQGAPAATYRPESLPRGEERVLLVDDEESVAYVTALRLEMLGYKVTQFTDSLLALEAFRSDPGGFDIAITDKTMPSLTGRSLARALRKLRPGLPIVLCSGFSSPSDGARGGDADIDAVVTKPIAYGELAKLVRKLLDRKKEA